MNYEKEESIVTSKGCGSVRSTKSFNQISKSVKILKIVKTLVEIVRQK